MLKEIKFLSSLNADLLVSMEKIKKLMKLLKSSKERNWLVNNTYQCLTFLLIEKKMVVLKFKQLISLLLILVQVSYIVPQVLVRKITKCVLLKVLSTQTNHLYQSTKMVNSLNKFLLMKEFKLKMPIRLLLKI